MSEKKVFVLPEVHVAFFPDGMNQHWEEYSDTELEELLNSRVAREVRRLYRIKDGYCVRDFCGESLVIPVSGAALEERKMAIINPVGKFLWDKLQTGQTMGDLLLAVLCEYEVSREEALEDIREFLAELETYKYLIIEKKEDEK
ncbi:MAG: PqqD family protein [Clostridiales bacterium]|nr:PqqD family protein [Clostridiales bacterium]